jgi:type IV pilus assembly protein PilE
MPCPHAPGATRRPPAASRADRRRRGFTLVELCTVLAVAGVLATLAWPAWQGQLQQARRADAHSALQRLQAEQERYRGHHGLYAADLAVLQGTSAVSPQGHYRIELHRLGAETYRASALAQGPQRADSDCAMLTMDVHLGFVRTGPAARCWHR